jgi:hypothetical protein
MCQKSTAADEENVKILKLRRKISLKSFFFALANGLVEDKRDLLTHAVCSFQASILLFSRRFLIYF